MRFLVISLFVGTLVADVACGSSGTTQPGFDAAPSGSCAAGKVYCSGCGGGGFCSAACPALSCPSLQDAGGDGGTGGTGCAGDASTSCLDCSGEPFCVSDACPALSCPTTNDSGDGLSDSAPSCPTTPPSPGQTCVQPQGCSGEGTCLYCASTTRQNAPTVCTAADDCRWAAKQISNGDLCPSTPPTQSDSCSSTLQCYYCAPSGLLVATCSSTADTYTWSVGNVSGS